VELIAEVHDFFHSYVVPRYRGIEPADYALILLEAGDEILRGVHPTLAVRARRRLDRQGIEVRTRARVSAVVPGGVELAEGGSVKAGLVVWAAGVKGHPVLAGVPVARDRLGRIVVNGQLRVPGYPEVYGTGDAVTVEGKPQASIPIIPAALAHGRLAAENIVADLEGRPLKPIEFAPRGMLVSLGEKDAVVEVMGLKFSGYTAWLFWNAVHLWKLVGLRKQLQVALDWGLARLFPRDSAMMRRPARCPVCARSGGSQEYHAA
jgi:NADH dehydrogenase